jgi:hypothetical protein
VPAALFLAPVVVVGQLLEMVVRPRAADVSRWQLALVCGAVWLLSLVVVLVLFTDLQLFRIYEYHFKAFVWNLLTTPGGLPALGVTEETTYTVAALVILAAIVLAAMLWFIHRGAARRRSGPPSLCTARWPAGRVCPMSRTRPCAPGNRHMGARFHRALREQPRLAAKMKITIVFSGHIGKSAARESAARKDSD